MARGRPGSLRIGSFLGVPIYADLSLFLTGALVAYAFVSRLDGVDPTLGYQAYVVAAGFAALLYLSILVHELAHAAVGLAFHLPVRSVALSMLGGVTDLGRSPRTPGRSFAISAAGPAATLVIAGAGWSALQIVPENTLGWLVLASLTVSNLVVGVYNLLPGLPLDGGSMLAAVLWKLTGSELSGLRWAAWAGRGIAVLTAALPFILAAATGTWPTTLFIVWAAILAVVLWNGSNQALQSARVRDRLPRLTLRGLVRPSLRVPGSMPLAEALRQLTEHSAGGIVVVDGDGRPTALVSEAAVAATPVERRPWISVSEVARGIVPGLVLRSDLAGEGLIDALRNQPATEYLVVDDGNLVLGVLSTSDVERVFSDV
jgi:Zn-dependent protease/CBS domain-containing protein